MRSLAAILLALATCATASAQAPSSPAAPAPEPSARELERAERAEGRRNQKVERIHLEDGANVIDETRFGGQTQSITVQPKNRMPEYEIQPNDLSRTRPSDNRDGGINAPGKSLWNVHKF